MKNRETFCELTAHLRMLFQSESYSASTVRDMDFILKVFTAFMDENGLDQYTPEIGERLIYHCQQRLMVCSSRVERANIIVRKLNRLQQGLDGWDALWGTKTNRVEVIGNFKEILDVYLSFCVAKGNKQTTIRYKRWICCRFLNHLAELGCQQASDIHGEQIQSAFLQLGCVRYWERIGPFLRFLFENGMVHHDYSGLIRNRKKHTQYPTVYSTDEIAIVEDSVDRTTPAGTRNYAIILLLSRYGIRSRDIAALSFENIDFANNRIHFIQQKTGDPWDGEMFPELSVALRQYIQNVRPTDTDCPQIFMTLTIPHKPIDSFAINTMVWTIFGKSKVAIAERRHGSRAFRSSIASNMINDNVPTEIVRRVLGHGTKHALKHYARIDVEHMRLCALPVPEPSGTFAKLLAWKEGEHDVS